MGVTKQVPIQFILLNVMVGSNRPARDGRVDDDNDDDQSPLSAGREARGMLVLEKNN